MRISLNKIKENIALGFIKLVLAWTIVALSFQVFMLITLFTNPELNTKIGNAIMWKIDGTFKNDPNNIWYEGPSK
jgi:hypothetical protein